MQGEAGVVCSFRGPTEGSGEDRALRAREKIPNCLARGLVQADRRQPPDADRSCCAW